MPPDAAPLTALATSMAVVAVTSVSSVLSHHRLGNVDWSVFRVTVPVTVLGAILYTALGVREGVRLPGQFGYPHLLAFLEISLASVVTAPLGARLASRVPARLLKRVFGVALIPLALKIAVG